MARNKVLDWLKGQAAILVVVGHVIQYGSTTYSYESNAVYNIIYSFHMPLFMFLSGYAAWYSIKKDKPVGAFVQRQ